MKLSDIPPELIDLVLLKTDILTFWKCQSICKLFWVSSTKELKNRKINRAIIETSAFLVKHFSLIKKVYLNKGAMIRAVYDELYGKRSELINQPTKSTEFGDWTNKYADFINDLLPLRKLNGLSNEAIGGFLSNDIHTQDKVLDIIEVIDQLCDEIRLIV